MRKSGRVIHEAPASGHMVARQCSIPDASACLIRFSSSWARQAAEEVSLTTSSQRPCLIMPDELAAGPSPSALSERLVLTRFKRLSRDLTLVLIGTNRHGKGTALRAGTCEQKMVDRFPRSTIQKPLSVAGACFAVDQCAPRVRAATSEKVRVSV